MTFINNKSGAPAQNNAKFYVLGPGQGVPGFGADVKASHASTGGALTAMESRTRGGAPMHVHSREDECFYVVEGTIIGRCGEDTFEAGPRSFVFLPVGFRTHGMWAARELPPSLSSPCPVGLRNSCAIITAQRHRRTKIKSRPDMG